jgi:RHS repeat-associated protein
MLKLFTAFYPKQVSLSGSPLIAFTVLLLALTTANYASAQSSLNGATPLGLAPGSPAGSYALGGFDTVNLFNGNLSINLPLVSVGGRGGAGTNIGLPIDQKWIVESYYDPIYGGYRYFPTSSWWTTTYEPAHASSSIEGRSGGSYTQDCYLYDPPRPFYVETLTRLTFTALDGTEYELRDALTGGQPLRPLSPSGCPSVDPARGKVFVTADGTSATFISDTDIYDYIEPDSPNIQPSGYLLLRDGTRYRFENGRISWIRDRNGNRLTFAHTYGTNPTTTITDSLNRQVTVTKDVNDPIYGLCDRISYKGFGGTARNIYITKTNLSNALRPGYSIQTYNQLFPELDGGSPYSPYDVTVPDSVWLPNGKRYRFLYNSYGEIARVELPTGGAIEYDYAPGSYSSGSGVVGSGSGYAIYRRVIERRVYSNGTTLDYKMTYSRPDVSGQSYVETDTYDASGNLLARQRHYFYGSASNSFGQSAIGYPSWKHGREYKTEVFDFNGSTLLRRIENTWEQRAPVSWWTGSADTAPPNDPRITQSITTLVDTNQVVQQTLAYDQYNNRTDVYEYHYGNGAAGAFARRTHTDYLTTNPVNGADYASPNPTVSSIHIRSLPVETWISSDAAGNNKKSRTTFEYDNYTADANHAALVNRSGISGLDAAFTTGYTTRGNVTAVSGWLLPSSTITTYQQYDIAGNPVKIKDGRGYETVAEYDDRFGSPNGEARANSAPSELGSQTSYAFVTKVTNALGQSTYSQFDFYAGHAVDGEDINGIVSSGYSTAEPLDRPTRIIRAVGTSAQNQTTFAYDDTNRIITTTGDFDSYNDNQLKSEALYDGLGRTFETRSYENGSAYIKQTQTFDALGRVKRAYNPHRTTSDSTYGWVDSTYDALGRVTQVTTSDNAIASTSYSGNAVTVTDQAGKTRRSITDALGRLERVDEPDIYGNLGSTGSPIQPTYYSYDELNSLTTVTQGVQTRTFVYDSLSRLTSAANPESGSVNYDYDNNGNLTSKVDARSITTTFAYDALNRPTSRTYTNDPQNTAPVYYYYDNQSLPTSAPSFSRGYSTGRLVAVTYGSGSSNGTYRAYDVLGRVTQQFQQTDGVNYQVDAAYNLVNGMTSQTYPGASDRRTVSYSFDTAGRLSSLNSNATSYASSASVSNISYAAHGGLSSETYGNNLVHQIGYNSRLQPTSITLGSALSLSYSYGTTANNGNVTGINYLGGGLSYSQSFTYDSLNRLATAQEKYSKITNWTQTNGYDRYGNRTVTAGGGQSLSFDTNNRIVGLSYDNAGNLLNDGVHSYAYDAENKIVRVDGFQSYIYDGEGKRVRKLIGENIRMVYGIGGGLLAEYSGSTGAIQKEYVYGADGLTATIEGSNTQYLTADHLGSPRVVTNASGAVTLRRDFKPFGEEITAGTGGRSTVQGWGASNSLRQQFTSYERDNESELDYAQARYFNSGHGRFTSPDDFKNDSDINDPQSMNKYVYVRNNPLTLIDPDGRIAMESTHIDDDGRVIAVIYDGDTGVYQHKDNADGKSPTEYMIKKRQERQGSSAGGTRIGETAYWDEFISPETGRTMTNVVIRVGKTFDNIIQEKKNEAKEMDLVEIAANSGSGGKFDIKKDFVNVGGLLEGKYATSRSAGNFLAGYNARGATYFGVEIEFDTFQKIAGAMHHLGRSLTRTEKADIVIRGKSYGPAPAYGENMYQYRMSAAGWNRGSR